MIIGDRLRELRQEKKLSQGDIEERTGLFRSYISRVEHNHSVPNMENLEKKRWGPQARDAHGSENGPGVAARYFSARSHSLYARCCRPSGQYSLAQGDWNSNSPRTVLIGLAVEQF